MISRIWKLEDNHAGVLLVVLPINVVNAAGLAISPRLGVRDAAGILAHESYTLYEKGYTNPLHAPPSTAHLSQHIIPARRLMFTPYPQTLSTDPIYTQHSKVRV